MDTFKPTLGGHIQVENLSLSTKTILTLLVADTRAAWTHSMMGESGEILFWRLYQLR